MEYVMSKENKPFKYYPTLLTIIVTIQMMCFFLSKRQIDFLGLTVNGSGLLFPLDVYLFEIIGYCYGYEYSRHAVWTNILVHVGFFGIITIIKYMPYAPSMHHEYVIAYKTIFQFSIYMIIGSLVGELVGDFFSAVVVPFSKVKLDGKFSMLTILIVHLISSFLVVSLAYIITNLPDGYTIKEIGNLVYGTMIIKSVIAIIMLPIAKYIIRKIKEAEGVDIYDINQKYSMFKFNPDFNNLKCVKFKGNYEIKKNLNDK